MEFENDDTLDQEVLNEVLVEVAAVPSIDCKKLKKEELLCFIKEKAKFIREIDNCLFFVDVMEDPQKHVYRLNINDGSVLCYTNKELDALYPVWNKGKKETDEDKKEDVDVFPELHINGALVHRTPYLTDKNFSYKETLAKKEDYTKECPCLNTYRFPRYLLNYDRNDNSNCGIPEVFEDFLHHLFKGDIDEIVYCINWIAWSLDPKIRHLPYLCLIDAKEGVGKGRLTSVIRKLHGDRENSRELSDKFLKGQFNSQIEGLTFAAINEVHLVGEDQHNRCKALIDDMIEIEAKGQDAREVRNYCKILINSNEIALNVTKESRRFSALKTTDVPLKDNKALLKEYGGLENFLKLLGSKETIDRLGVALNWYRDNVLYADRITYNHLQIFFSEFTENLIEKAMPEWQNEMIYEMPKKILQDWVDAGHDFKEEGSKKYIDLSRSDFKEKCRHKISFFQGNSKSLPSFAKIDSIFEGGYTHIVRPLKNNGGRFYRVYNNYDIFKKSSLF